VTDNIVEVDDLVVTFGSLRAVDGVSLRIPRGTVYGLLGPNGAGKTTLIRVLTTLLRPASGSARVAGIDVLAEPTRARAHIGLAGQFAAIDEYQTGRENVVMVGRLYGLSGREAKRRADEILERIHLTDAANRRVGTYSGGMRRRLDLAASLVGRPQVMFLDEPTTGIDPRSRQDLWDLVHDLVDAGTTVLLTTQYLEEADRLCERIGVIDDGRLITEGTSSELKDQLGTGVVEVGVDEPDRATVVEIMSSLGEDDAFWDGRTLMAVTRTLDARGIEPHDVSIHRPTLDDVFLALTGDSPSSEPGENEGDHIRGRRGRRGSRKASA
jgi:daunorubicin resistance ABC transporter ATP-binding subunit